MILAAEIGEILPKNNMGSVTAKPREASLHSLNDAKNIYAFFISRARFKKGKQVGQDLVR